MNQAGPLSEKTSTPETKLDSTGRPSSLDSVLVAEDDPIFRHLLGSWLQRWNYKVTAVENGLDAWNALQEAHAPQLVVLDWMMPGMDGVELCRRIRANGNGPYRYVLLLTAKYEKQDVVEGLDAGADDYLTKPFDVDELRARVRAGKRILELQHALLRSQEALQYEAAHDRLTGLWNRGAVMDMLRRETQRHQRTGSHLGVVMVDVDHFKQINDTYGHLVGDGVLQEVARRLASFVRAYDFVGRYGGEEFLAVMPSCSPSDLVNGAERLRCGIADKPIETSAGPIQCTISLGVASAPVGDRESSELEALLRVSDEALYLAKRNGRNRVEIAPGSKASQVGA
jgi:diguanylate cyclase (GGDEF)-like protein